MVRIPQKIKPDAIAEALFDIRFQTPQVAEVLLGKIATRKDWRDFQTSRLPLADIPQAIRDNDKNLREQPLWQLTSKDGKRVLKVGPRVFSIHAIQPYPGWTAFEPELISAANALFEALKDFSVSRYGFRYLNVLTKEHHINRLSDLNLQMNLAGKPLSGEINLNYTRQHSAAHVALVRIAPPALIDNPAPNLTVLVDIDIYTPTDYQTDGSKTVAAWLNDAHNFEKQEFFTLLPQEIIDKLEVS